MQNSRMHVFLLKWLDFACENWGGGGGGGNVSTYLTKTETIKKYIFLIK